MPLSRSSLAALAIATAAACSQPNTRPSRPGAPAAAGALAVRSFTSSTDGYGVGVSSHLIVGPTEAVLVDGQLYRADAEAVVQLVRASGRRLTRVFLTHAHPDHFMGLDIIRAAFPDAAFVATPPVLADYNAGAPPTFRSLKGQLGELVADRLVALTALEGTSLVIDGESVEVIDVGTAGESAHAAALALPTGPALIAGDLVYSGVHLYLGECTSAGWKSALDALAARRFTAVYAGHGPSGDAALIEETRRYIEDVIPLLEANREGSKAGGGADPAGRAAISAVAARYPGWRSGYLLEASTKQFYTGCTR
jgi:glyoxylase-like metal-dependent hydrolase (beta-lactamase superfamily II)